VVWVKVQTCDVGEFDFITTRSSLEMNEVKSFISFLLTDKIRGS